MVTAILLFLNPARKEVCDADQDRLEVWKRSLGPADRLGQGNGGAARAVSPCPLLAAAHSFARISVHRDRSRGE